MYNFSGIVYRIWGVSGVMLLLGIVCILFEKPWTEQFRIKNCKVGIVLVVFAICSGSILASRIVFPQVSSYTGEFIRSNRNSRVAPPLPFTTEYVFESEDGQKKGFYLDTFSKKEIFTLELEKNQEYVVYFDKSTNVIVKIELCN